MFGLPLVLRTFSAFLSGIMRLSMVNARFGRDLIVCILAGGVFVVMVESEVIIGGDSGVSGRFGDAILMLGDV